MAARARDAGERAVASGPDLAETHTALGTVRSGSIGTGPRRRRRTDRPSPSTTAIRRHTASSALSLDPRSARSGPEAMSHARELDPSNPVEHALSAALDSVARNYAGGLRFAQQAKTIGATFWIGLFQLGLDTRTVGELRVGARRPAGSRGRSRTNSKILSLRGYILRRWADDRGRGKC